MTDATHTSLDWNSAPPRLDVPRLDVMLDAPALPDMVVRLAPTCFVVCDPLLEDLVGAPALPLPYTPQRRPGTTVVAALQRNNPTRTVRFDPAPWAAPRDLGPKTGPSR